jgi:hypothetical protein
VAYFKVLSWNLPNGNEKCSDSSSNNGLAPLIFIFEYNFFNSILCVFLISKHELEINEYNHANPKSDGLYPGRVANRILQEQKSASCLGNIIGRTHQKICLTIIS